MLSSRSHSCLAQITACSAAPNSQVPHQLNMGGAALLNLSLLTSDLWTALARVVLFGMPNLLALHMERCYVEYCAEMPPLR